jgi:coenzyme F420-reducing hydrogenase alpha subunit
MARVEGEGGITVTLKGDAVDRVELDIFEPPRFFEALLRGRRFTEAPDVTARICGICPVAYQMSSVHAMERACGVTVDGALRDLRRLLYCGEWIESHVLHVVMLHAPDFLGYQSGLHLAKDQPALVERGLQLKKLGNDIVRVVGGREIHPVNVKVGGFHRVPTRRELAPLRARLDDAYRAAEELVRWTAGFDFPDFEQPWVFVALRHEREYPFCDGRVCSSDGLAIDVSEFEREFIEEHVQHSNALHCRRRDGSLYHVGPLARWALNADHMPADIRHLASAVGVGPVERNPFRSIVVRSLETLFAVHEARRIIDGYVEPDESSVPVTPRDATGWGASEAPRGTLYHRYRITADGLIAEAKIVPPTSQNQGTIEGDLRAFVTPRVGLPVPDLTWQCEQAVRNYDPCISCATHFLRLEVRR